jgi:hypothetical protein
MRDVLATVAMVCLPCRYAHLHVCMQKTLDAYYPSQSTTKQQLGYQGIKKWWPN